LKSLKHFTISNVF